MPDYLLAVMCLDCSQNLHSMHVICSLYWNSDIKQRAFWDDNSLFTVGRVSIRPRPSFWSFAGDVRSYVHLVRHPGYIPWAWCARFAVECCMMKNGERYCGTLQMSKTLPVFLAFILLFLFLWIQSTRPITYFTLRPDIRALKFTTANSTFY